MNCATPRRFAWAISVVVLTLVTMLSIPLGHAQTGTTTVSLVPGWNLVGMGSSGSLSVATAFSDASKVTTVWKWMPSKSGWAFYAPSLPGQQLADYAAGKGYDVLTTIDGGEGYWVNAKTSFTVQMPSGTTVSSVSFRASLFPGWNLIAVGDNKTAGEFNQALGATPPLAGQTPQNLITLWAWDALQANWYFYAPSLVAQGASALAAYIASKGYLDFGSKLLDAATGFWVNKAASTSPLVVDTLSKYAANPLSLVTLNGAGFNPKARLHVRFFDATGFSLEIPAASASESAVSVATPPYIDVAGGRFGSGTVSVQLVQRSGSETRLSAEIPGFTINPLPTPPLANGSVTDRWLDFALYAAPNAKSDLARLETSYASAPSTSALRGWITGLETEMAQTRQIMSTTAGGSPATIGTFRGSALVLDTASVDAMDQLVYAAILALGPNSPSPCAAKDVYLDQLMSAASGSAEYSAARAGYAGGVLTCTNTELLDFTTKGVAVLGVLGAIATATGVTLSLPAVAAIGFVALAPAVFVMLTQTEAISLSGTSQQAAENLKGAVQLFQDSIFDPVASSMLSLATPAASLSYDTYFAFKSATEEVMKHLSSYDIALRYASTTTSTTSTTTSTAPPSTTTTSTAATTTSIVPTTTTIVSTTSTTLAAAEPAVSIGTASCTVGERFSWGTIVYNVIAASGSASGPVGTGLYVNGPVICSAWTDCVRQQGQPETTGWTVTWTTGTWSPQQVYALAGGSAEAYVNLSCPTQ